MISPAGVLPLTQAERQMLLKKTPPEFKFTKEKLRALKMEHTIKTQKKAAAAAAGALEKKKIQQHPGKVRANFTWDLAADNDSVDWRAPRLLYSDGFIDTTSKVTPPAFQLGCGSCYMFAAVAQIASYCAIKNKVAAQPINPTAYLENCSCLFSKQPALYFDDPPCLECPQPPNPTVFSLTNASDMAYLDDNIDYSCLTCTGGKYAFVLKRFVDVLQVLARDFFPTSNAYIAQGTRLSYPFLSNVNSAEHDMLVEKCTNRNQRDRGALQEIEVEAICKLVSSLNFFPHSNLEIYRFADADAALPDYLPIPRDTKTMFFDYSEIDCVADREVLLMNLIKNYGPVTLQIYANATEVNEAESRQEPFIVYPESAAPNQEPGHAVLVIGYTTLQTSAGEKDVWIIKNSYSFWGNSENVYYLPRGMRTWTQADWSKWGSWGAQSILADSQMLCVLYTGDELMCQVKYPKNYYNISNDEPCNAACQNNELDLASGCTACTNAELQPPACWTCKKHRKSSSSGCADCETQYVQSELCDACANPDHSLSSDCMLCTRGKGFNPTNCSTCGTGYTGTNCDTCAAGYVFSSGACIRGCAEGNYDSAATPPCSSCVSHYDLGSHCTQCLPGYDLGSHCTRCVNEYDSASGCTTCLPNYDIDSKCTKCLPGYDIATGCE